MANQPTDIICGVKTTRGVTADDRNDGLWLGAADLQRVSGWVFKPEGFCKGEVCVPVPPSRTAEFVSGQSYNLVALAGLLGQPVVADTANHAWCIGEASGERRRVLQSLEAPNFTLPDLTGKMYSLSDYRGKRVFLVSWASW
ncbi:MAG: redoxin domain-containing protein [Deltaproteobacteria bacterium]|nr:redoxin domain-containing protein [Deltaproteobacteria bacterium]